MNQVTAGTLLISDPFLKDPNFLRSVVLICEHQQEGSFGFVLNKLYNQKLNELMSDLGNIDYPVYYGGPVQVDTLHFLHRRPDVITGGIQIIEDIYWGGSFDQVLSLLTEGLISKNDIRFFIGYSGWGEGQLENELTQKSWITHIGSKKLIFHKNTALLWKDALLDMGGEYSILVNYPIDPQLN